MMAAVQRRTGPYNVGYFGLLQSMDDGLKLVKNEGKSYFDPLWVEYTT